MPTVLSKVDSFFKGSLRHYIWSNPQRKVRQYNGTFHGYLIKNLHYLGDFHLNPLHRPLSDQDQSNEI